MQNEILLIEILENADFSKNEAKAVLRVIEKNNHDKQFITKDTLKRIIAENNIKLLLMMLSVNGILFALLRLTGTA